MYISKLKEEENERSDNEKRFDVELAGCFCGGLSYVICSD
jgi:hypothetical protein